ncbi:MAG: D-2-hydroxyacid dehydrogenase, partial [Tuberibacillus sp.]
QDQLVKNHPEIEFRFHKNIHDAIPDIPAADVLITYGEDLTDEIIYSTKELKWIMVISAGLDQMPFEAIKAKDIIVTNARGIHKIPMAEYTFAAILQWCKRTKEWTDNQEKRIWNKYGVKMTELAGRTITVIGTGAIGGEIARIAKAFRMTTLGVNRSGRNAEHFDHIYMTREMKVPITQSDVVVSVLPYTPESDHLIGEEQLAAMKDGSLFINIGRGKTVDQEALLSVLRNQNVSAVLDVFEEEPLPKDHPFWGMENVTITPHFSSITSQYQPRSIEIFEQNLLRFKENRKDLINLIDPDRGY